MSDDFTPSNDKRDSFSDVFTSDEPKRRPGNVNSYKILLPMIAVILAVSILSGINRNARDSAMPRQVEEAFPGRPVTVEEVCEVTVQSCDISREVKPSQAKVNDQYLSLTSGTDEMYVDLLTSYKNLSGEAISSVEAVGAYIEYNGKYYYGAPLAENEARSNLVEDAVYIGPGEERWLHYVIAVPKEAGLAKDRLVINFNAADDNYYFITIRKGSE